jgi:hypothetical protein
VTCPLRATAIPHNLTDCSMTEATQGNENAVDLPWYSSVTLSDVAVESRSAQVHGRSVQQFIVATILGVSFFDIRHPELRSICAKLGVTGYKNKKKDEMALLIAAKKQNEEIYDGATVGSCPAKPPAK